MRTKSRLSASKRNPKFPTPPHAASASEWRLLEDHLQRALVAVPRRYDAVPMHSDGSLLLAVRCPSWSPLCRRRPPRQSSWLRSLVTTPCAAPPALQMADGCAQDPISRGVAAPPDLGAGDLLDLRLDPASQTRATARSGRRHRRYRCTIPRGRAGRPLRPSRATSSMRVSSSGQLPLHFRVDSWNPRAGGGSTARQQAL